MHKFKTMPIEMVTGTDEPPPGFKRRQCAWLRWAAERTITDAMMEVEAMPADERLTRALNLLSDARDAVADFIDGIDGKAP